MSAHLRLFLVTVIAGAAVAGCSSGGAGKDPAVARATATPDASTEAGRDIECTQREAHVLTTFAPAANDLVVGSISWPGLLGWASTDPAAPDGNHKIGAVVKAGKVVTVSVADGTAGLSYGQGWGYSPAPAVTFHACADADTAFIGGFHVPERRCVPLVITEDGMPPARITVSFFAGAC
ncbi:hypothetical protein BJ973_002996 [Actinoplanes tereljensis]|uniref:Uncharacterized protein n=1 Tax=Paractinoplanes tereljensis TaxID=571912 RepID=A0A919NPJ5_9ACTN|nr:hypothetical protein [Actinoplanes tereljensis]GIF22675.1 hypothetical protein Ate02nite_54050 [Actinoplanes tereljensis]